MKSADDLACPVWRGPVEIIGRCPDHGLDVPDEMWPPPKGRREFYRWAECVRLGWRAAGVPDAVAMSGWARLIRARAIAAGVVADRDDRDGRGRVQRVDPGVREWLREPKPRPQIGRLPTLALRRLRT